MRAHPRSELRHHVSASVYRDEAQSFAVRGDVPAELRARVRDRERRPEQQRLLVQQRERHAGRVEKVRPLRSPRSLTEPDASHRLPGTFVGHARVGIPVEHDRRI